MLENILKMNIIKKVNKHWGHELWIADGVQQDGWFYASKRGAFGNGDSASARAGGFWTMKKRSDITCV